MISADQGTETPSTAAFPQDSVFTNAVVDEDATSGYEQAPSQASGFQMEPDNDGKPISYLGDLLEWACEYFEEVEALQ